MLKEQTLFGNINKVDIAIKRLQEFEPAEGYYLAFSGGKDSIIIYSLAKMARVKFDAHYNLTTVDPPELVRFIKRKYDDVCVERPEKNMWELIVQNKYPPTRIARYCCKYLKEIAGDGRTLITGIRWAESNQRKKRMMVENCKRHNSAKHFVHPIIDWSTEEVWEFIRTYKIAYCSLYDEGFKRIGCVLCPMQTVKDRIRDAKRWPKIKDGYIKAFDKCIKARLEARLGSYYKTGDEMFEWWINEKKKTKYNEKQFEFPL